MLGIMVSWYFLGIIVCVCWFSLRIIWLCLFMISSVGVIMFFSELFVRLGWLLWDIIVCMFMCGLVVVISVVFIFVLVLK